MGNQTTAASVAGLSPVAVIVEAVVQYNLPDFYSHVPAGTIAAAFLALTAYILPPVHTIFARLTGTAP